MDKKTGIFYVKNPPGVVVMQQGIEIARYSSVQEFIVAHQEGIQAVKQREEGLIRIIESQYKPSST